MIKDRFNRWAANCSLDYVSRQSKIQMVPKVILSWVNRLLSQGFKKWAKTVRLAFQALLKKRTTNIVLRLLLRNKAKKLLLRGFNGMRVGVATTVVTKVRACKSRSGDVIASL